MIILPGTSDLLRVVVGANESADLLCVVNYRSVTGSGYVPARQLTTAPVNATTTILSSPGASTTLVVDDMSIFNSSTLRPAKFQLQYYDGTNSFVLWSGYLGPNGKLVYKHKIGFRALQESGAVERVVTENAQGSVMTFSVNREIEVTGDGTGASAFGGSIPVGDIAFIIPKRTPCFIEFAANIYVSNTDAGVGFGIISNIQSSDAYSMGYAAGGRKTPTSTTAEYTIYSNNISALAAIAGTSAPVSSREGGNLVRGWGSFCSLGEDVICAASIGLENVASVTRTAKVLPGTQVTVHFGAAF